MALAAYRMPVILRPEQFEAWLDGSMGVDEIKVPIADDYLRRQPFPGG
jgi:putative SOS response-associated peptidase YedK